MDEVVLHTGSLELRPWRGEDAEQVFRICQDPEVQRWTRVPVPYERKDAVFFVERLSPEGWAAGTDALFAAVDAGSGEVLGSIGLMHVDHVDHRAELGLWVGPAARGRGVGSQGSRAVCRWAFEALQLQRVEWLAHTANAASRACAAKAGFVGEGVLRSRLDFRGTQVDAWVASLVPGDLAPGRGPVR